MCLSFPKMSFGHNHSFSLEVMLLAHISISSTTWNTLWWTNCRCIVTSSLSLKSFTGEQLVTTKAKFSQLFYLQRWSRCVPLPGERTQNISSTLVVGRSDAENAQSTCSSLSFSVFLCSVFSIIYDIYVCCFMYASCAWCTSTLKHRFNFRKHRFLFGICFLSFFFVGWLVSFLFLSHFSLMCAKLSYGTEKEKAVWTSALWHQLLWRIWTSFEVQPI